MPRRSDATASSPACLPTIGDVARVAGVSRSAVSRTFTEGASASPPTRAKVLAAAAALGYRPNLLARSLATQRSSLVAISVARLENEFNACLLQALALGLDARGLRTLLFPTAGATADGDPPLDHILKHRVDAVVLLATRLSSDFAAECAAVGVPVLMVNRTAAGNGAAVVGDNLGGAAQTAAFLLAGGHRRFAFMAGIEGSSTSREREAGFTGVLSQAGVAPSIRVAGHYDRATAAAAMRSLLGRDDPPDAVFCANDHMAIAAIDVARREFGLEVGRQISIVGFDDMPSAASPGHDLTTFSQPIAAMADGAVAAILGLVATPQHWPGRVTIAGRLVVRGSARCPAAGLQALSDGTRAWRSAEPAA